MTLGQVRSRSISLALIVSAFLLGVGAATASAAPGDIDGTYGTAGISTFLSAPSPDYNGTTPQAMHVLPDGKTLVVGSRRPTATNRVELTLIRLNTNGSLDLSFGGGDGITAVDVPSYNLFAEAVVVQSTGMIFVAGKREDNNGQYKTAFLARFSATGEPDTTGLPNSLAPSSEDVCTETWIICTPPFGLPVQPSDYLSIEDAIATADDGIALIGVSNPSGDERDTTVIRYSATGALQTPVAFTDATGTGAGDEAGYGALLADGSILIAGSAFEGGFEKASIVRYLANGTYDNSFAGDGVANIDLGGFGTASVANAIAKQPDGRLVVAGRAEDPFDSNAHQVAVARIDSNGNLDPSFSGDGRFTYQAGNADWDSRAMGVAVDNGGGITIGGDTKPQAGERTLFYAQLTPIGDFNAAYSVAGRRLISEAPAAELRDLQLGPNGTIQLLLQDENNPVQSIVRLQGPPPVVPIAAPIPQSKIKSPSKRKLKRTKLKAISGTAGPAGSVAKVEIALQRLDAKLLKKSKRCLWLSSAKAKFKKTKATRKKCSTPRFLKATGTTNWRYSLKKTLPAGSYKLFVRVTLTDGTKSSGYSVKGGTLKSFKLTK